MLNPDGPIAGVILAGGSSRRLGRPKQTLPYGEGTVLDHAVSRVEALAELDPVVVVLPAGDLVPDPIVSRARVVRRNQGTSCSSSLRAALETLPADVPAVAVLPADQPGLTADVIRLAVRAWLQNRPPALAVSFRGQLGHPLIFSSSLLPELHGLHGEKAMWRFLENLNGQVQQVQVDAPVPPDIDTWADYRQIVC